MPLSDLLKATTSVSKLFTEGVLDKVGDIYEALTVEDAPVDFSSIGGLYSSTASPTSGVSTIKLPGGRNIAPVAGLSRLLGSQPGVVGDIASAGAETLGDPLNVLGAAGIAKYGRPAATALRSGQGSISELFQAGKYGEAAQSALRKTGANIVDPLGATPGESFAKELALGATAEGTTVGLKEHGVSTPIALGAGLGAGLLSVASIDLIRNTVKNGFRAALKESTIRGTGPKLGMFETRPHGELFEVLGPDGRMISLEAGKLEPYFKVLENSNPEHIARFEELTNTQMFKDVTLNPNPDNKYITFYEALLNGAEDSQITRAVRDWSGLRSETIRNAILSGDELGWKLYKHGEPLRAFLRDISPDGKTITLWRGENQVLETHYAVTQKLKDQLIARGLTADQAQKLISENYIADIQKSTQFVPQNLQSYTLDPEVAARTDFGGVTTSPQVVDEAQRVRNGVLQTDRPGILPGDFDPEKTYIIQRQVPIDDIVTALPDFNMLERELIVMARPRIPKDSIERITSNIPVRPEDFSKGLEVSFGSLPNNAVEHLKEAFPKLHLMDIEDQKRIVSIANKWFNNPNAQLDIFTGDERHLFEILDSSEKRALEVIDKFNLESPSAPAKWLADQDAAQGFKSSIHNLTDTEKNTIQSHLKAGLDFDFWDEKSQSIWMNLYPDDQSILELNAGVKASKLGVVEGSGDARASIDSGFQRENLRSEERRKEIRNKLNSLPDKEVIRQALEYGIDIVDNLDQLKDTLSTYIFQGLEEVTNYAQVLREYEAAFRNLPRAELVSAAEKKGLETAGTNSELATRLVDSFIDEAGLLPKQVRLNTPPRPQHIDITTTKTAANTAKDSIDFYDEIASTELPPSFNSIFEEAQRGFDWDSIPKNEKFTHGKGSFGGDFNPPPPKGPNNTFSGSGEQLPFEPVKPNLVKKFSPSDPINVLNQTLKTLWATADASWYGIQGLLPMVRLATTGASKEAKDVILNALHATVNPKSLDEFFYRHNHVWSQVDPRLNLQWLQSNGLNLATKGGGSDIGGFLSILEDTPVISHANRLFHSTGDLARIATVLNEFQLRGGTRLTDEQLIQIVQSANRITGYSDSKFLGRHGDVLMFAPRFFMAQIETITKAFIDGGIEGDMARRSLISLIGIGSTITFGANYARGEYDHSMWDPTSSNFMRIRNVGGVDISVFGPWDSLVRAIGRTIEDPQEGLRFFARSKSSPIIGVAWDLLSGKDFLGRDLDATSFISGLILPFAYNDMGDYPLWTAPLNALGVKSAPLTPNELLEDKMEKAGLSANDPLQRREWLAANPSDYPLGTREDTLYRDAVRDDIKTRSALNDRRAITNQQTLTDWREARKNLLREQRIRLDTIFRNNSDPTPKNQQQAWINSYFKLFGETADPVTGDIVTDAFDQVLIEWLEVNGSQAYDYVQRYLLVGRSPLETAYLNDLNTLKKLNYFNTPKLRGMVSGYDESVITDLRRQVSAERSINPMLANMTFQQAAVAVLRGYPMSLRIDVGNAGLQQFQNPAVQRIEQRYQHLFAWFNPNMSYKQYARLSGAPTNPQELLTLEQKQLLEVTNIQ